MESERPGLSATQTLPPTYAPIWGLDLARSPRAALVLNLVSLPLFVLSACVFGLFSSLFKPGILTNLHVVLSSLQNSFSLLLFLAAVIFLMILHEAIHGVFFWVYTHTRPVFGLRMLLAYAGAPDWYIPRDKYNIIGLAPFVLISIFGLIVIPFVSMFVAQFVLLLITVNAAGAVGDLYVVGKTLRQPPTVLIQDTGAGFTMFGKINPTV